VPIKFALDMNVFYAKKRLLSVQALREGSLLRIDAARGLSSSDLVIGCFLPNI
jgi:hypothetical protein